MLTPLEGYVPIIPEIERKTVNFIDRDVPISEEHVQPRPVDEVLQMTGMTAWTNTIYVHAADLEKASSDTVTKLTNLAKKSRDLEDKLALSPMPVGLTGYEVIAIQPITRGSFLLYSGAYLEQPPSDIVDPYIMALHEKTGPFITARDCGNFSRFFSSAFSEESLLDDIFFYSPEKQKETLSHITLANFVARPYDTAFGRIVILMANRDISLGEQVVFDYGFQYFQNLKTSPLLFNKHDRSLIDRRDYGYKRASVKYYFKGEWFDPELALDKFIQEYIRGDGYVSLPKTDAHDFNRYIHVDTIVDLLLEHPEWLQEVSLKLDLTTVPSSKIKHIKSDQDLDRLLFKAVNKCLGQSLTDWGTASSMQLDFHHCLTDKKARVFFFLEAKSGRNLDKIKEQFELTGLIAFDIPDLIPNKKCLGVWKSDVFDVLLANERPSTPMISMFQASDESKVGDVTRDTTPSMSSSG